MNTFRKTLKKTLSLIISLIFILSCFISCSFDSYGGDHKRYDLKKIDGQDYLVIRDEVKEMIQESVNEMSSENRIAKPRAYDTFDEFVDTVKNGKLSDEDLAEMSYSKSLQSSDPNGIKILDFENFQVPKVPDIFEPDLVEWDGCVYLCQFSSKDEKSTSRTCVFRVSDKKTAGSRGYIYTEEKFAYYNEAYITEVKKVGDRTEYYHRGSEMEEWKTVWYTIGSGESKMHVKECYKLKDSKGQDVSGDIPVEVTVNATKGDWFFTLYHRKLTEKPTVEWLSQFSLEDYKG